MQHTVQLISKLFILGSLLILASCAHTPPPEDRPQRLQQKVFNYSYESVWRAAQLSLRYPIYINNMDTGVLETEMIKSIDGYLAPFSAQNPPGGIRYKITLSVAKGKISGKESCRVTITKTMEKQSDFFSDPEAIQTDGLEEKILFYRIERELVIDEALKKAQAKINKEGSR